MNQQDSLVTNTTESNFANDPTIFSRGSLKLTYDLIRPGNAQLALTVRNIIGGHAMPKDESQKDNPHSDHFRVELDSFQVRYIVEGLVEQLQKGAMSDTNPGQVIVAKALIEDWTALARKMIAELPADQAP